MRVDFRLRLLKALINIPIRLFDKMLPERSPQFPQTVIVDRMFGRMFRAYELERAQGVFAEGDGALEDGNFLRLLRTSRKLLLAIGDDDRYYREWLGLLVILASEEYQRWLGKVSPAEIKYWCRAQWYVSPDCLSDQAVMEVKDKLAPDVLAYYLPQLAKEIHSNLAQKGE